MGFDFHIHLKLMIDPKTGIAFVWGDFVRPIPYNPSEYIVPEKYRKWVHARGSHFHAYIQTFSSETSYIDIDSFYDSFPSWENVCSNIQVQDYNWTQQDHNDFKEAIEWFYKKDCFLIHWSY